MAQPAAPSLTRPLLEKAQRVLVLSSSLPQPGTLPGGPGLKPSPTVNTGPELLPPSSFMPRGVDTPPRVSPRWPPGVPFFSLVFSALSHALGAVATAIPTASGRTRPQEEAVGPLIHSLSTGAAVLGTQ